MTNSETIEQNLDTIGLQKEEVLSGEQLVERSLDNIQTVEDRVVSELHLVPHSAAAIEATDQALIHMAEGTITSSASPTEKEIIIDSIAIETALEIEHGMSGADTPAVAMELDGFDQAITYVVARLHQTHAVLPSNHEVAPYVEQAIDALNQHSVMTEPGELTYVENGHTMDVSQGSLESTWRQRSAAAEQVKVYERKLENNGRTYDLGAKGTIGNFGWQPGYQVDKVPIAFPINPSSPDGVTYRPLNDMGRDERALYGIDNEQEDKHYTEVPFDSLSPDAKQSILSARLLEIEATSQDKETRDKAVQKNLERLGRHIVIEPTDYIHGINSNPTILRSILNTGLVAGEAVGSIDGKAPLMDTFPYNLDLYDATEVGIVGENGALRLGEGTDKGFGDVVAVVERAPGNLDIGNEPSTLDKGIHGKAHKLIFGGIPSTDIRALQLRSNVGDWTKSTEQLQAIMTQKLSETVNTVVAEGMYIPVYDEKGNLALTPDEYQRRRETNEYTITLASPQVKVTEKDAPRPTSLWDFS